MTTYLTWLKNIAVLAVSVVFLVPVNYFVHTPSTCVKGLSFMAVACLLAPSCKTPAMTKIINYLGNLTD